MKRTMIARALSTTLLLVGMLRAAHADTWVFRDTLRPNGHDRSMAAKRADGRKCGASRSGRSFSDAAAPTMRECMFVRGWALDHIIPGPPSVRARVSGDDASSPQDAPSSQIDSSSNDDMVRRQQDQDNLQQMINNQQMINDQQMLNDQMFQQQQQQMIDNMNQ
jgi:uncharacterized low-complexity protein